MTTESSEARKQREAEELSSSIQEGEEMFLRMVLANAGRFGQPLTAERDGDSIRNAFHNWSVQHQ